MAINISRAANNATVTVTQIPVADLVPRSDLTADQKKHAALLRAREKIDEAIDALSKTDAELDALVASVQAQVIAKKATRPPGNF